MTPEVAGYSGGSYCTLMELDGATAGRIGRYTVWSGQCGMELLAAVQCDLGGIPTSEARNWLNGALQRRLKEVWRALQRRLGLG